MTGQLNTPSGQISASTTSARAAFTGGARTNMVYIYNGLAAHVHVRSGDSTVVATSADAFIPATTGKVFLKDTSHTHIAVLASSGTGTVLFAEEVNV